MRNKKKRITLYDKSIYIATGSILLLLLIPFILWKTQPRVPVNQKVLGTSVSLDSMIRQTLDSINQYGWNPTVNGMYINWYRNNPTQQQNTGHDGQNDLRMYENMVWYEARHPGDTSQQANIARILPTVQSEWGNSNLAKGWIYEIFLRLAKYSGDVSWNTTAEHWAASNYAKVVASNGIPLGPIVEDTGANAPTCPSGYRVDQNLETGLMLIDAGKRFNHPEWAQAGASEVAQIEGQAFNAKYHLFARIICQGIVWDALARDGEIGQEAEAFLDVGSETSNQSYLMVAQQMLDSVANPATGFVDPVNGGLFFSKNMQTGTTDTAKKVTQQVAILIAFHKADKLMQNRYATIEQDMITNSVEKAWFSPPVAGWMYELNPDWTLYKGTENWVSTEASTMAMEAMQLVLEDQTLTPPSFPTQNQTPTISKQPDTFFLTVCLHGLGDCGDNANPSYIGNTNPLHQKRNITLTFSDTTNRPIATINGTINYKPSTQNFQGSISINSLPKGQYVIQIKVEGYRVMQIPNIVTLSQGQQITLPEIFLTAGDINNDDKLDILDYNILLSCFDTKYGTSSCSAPNTAFSSGADIDDNGIVDGRDYNLFIRELSVQKSN